MSDELDDFLRQAAERRQKRQQQKGARPASPSPPPPAPAAPSPASVPPQIRRPVPPPPSPPTSAPVAPKRRKSLSEEASEVRPSVGSLDPALAKRHVESELAFADERMEQHLEKAFQSDLMPSQGRNAKQKMRGDPYEQMSAAAPIGAEQAKAMVSASELAQQLRDPKTLRLAIIAFEVMRRPYQ